MTRNFTKLAASVAIAMLALGVAKTSFAQEGGKDEIIRPITKQGSAAFVFSINGLGNFGISGPGIGAMDTSGLMLSGVGMKYFLADDMALRVLLAFRSISGNRNAADTASIKPSTTAFGVGVGVEHSFRPLYSTSTYVGGQISFSSISHDAGTSGTSTSKSSTSIFGVAALFGFDWFFTRGIAIGAEGALGFTSSSDSYTSGSQTSSGQSVTTIALATNGDVHLVVFF